MGLDIIEHPLKRSRRQTAANQMAQLSKWKNNRFAWRGFRRAQA
jgi:hypothetical protein